MTISIISHNNNYGIISMAILVDLKFTFGLITRINYIKQVNIISKKAIKLYMGLTTFIHNYIL